MNDRSFTIRLAGVSIEIHPMHDYIKKYCRDYLSSDAPEMTVSITEEDIRYERRISEYEDKLEGNPVRAFSDDYLETLAIYRKIAVELLNKDILLYHGSCVAVDGVAYLFTAKSGTGKSTHVQLWQKLFGERAVIVNDDKPLLAVTDNGVVAYGTPWDGKHHRSNNICCPLKAICILQRGEVNKLEKITIGEGYTTLLQQVYRPQEPAALIRTLQTLDKLLSKVEIYSLNCNMDPEAAQISYRGMNGGILS